MDKRRIGVFDSGIGGVTVLKEIIKVLPNEDYIYYSDSINNPYGEKTEDEIIKICNNIVDFFINKNCKIIVIACNTASAIAIDRLRKEYPDIFFVGIEPAYKMVYDTNKDKPTLIMATKGTIQSEKFNVLYKNYNNQKTYLLTCSGLADIIEDGNEKIIEKYLKDNLGKYKGCVENVVLGCTHYPLIKEKIKNVLGDVTFFDGSYRLAVHLKNILEKENILNDSGSLNVEFVDSMNSNEKKERFFGILFSKN